MNTKVLLTIFMSALSINCYASSQLEDDLETESPDAKWGLVSATLPPHLKTINTLNYQMLIDYDAKAARLYSPVEGQIFVDPAIISQFLKAHKLQHLIAKVPKASVVFKENGSILKGVEITILFEYCKVKKI